jgi:hypothetical protein
MKVKCRKCEIEWEFELMTFGDVDELQKMRCGVMGFHSIIGCNGNQGGGHQ